MAQAASKKSAVVAALIGALALGALLPMRTVTDEEMSWSLQPGDRVWILPMRVRKADVVTVADPLDPARTVLRRAVAAAGDKVEWEDGSLRINGKRMRQQEMGEAGEHKVVQEVIWSKPPARENHFLPRMRRDLKAQWSTPGVVTVPEGHWYLLAEDRDGALDSRFWGPVPEAAISGVARLRVGGADAWRPQPVELLLAEE
jgi:signal peptidase I